MTYDFLVETYETERIKTLSVWSSFEDADLDRRPNAEDPRGRSFLEQMVHQCLSEDLWFRKFFGVDGGAQALPENETRMEFIRRYAEDSGIRLQALRAKEESWWREEVAFFDVKRSRAWVLTRRMTHSAHHRGQLVSMLRMLGREVYSTYGPTADTGGLAQSGAGTIYPYPDIETLLRDKSKKGPLPGSGDKPVTERAERSNR